MATEVKLPRLGEGMESGTIVEWPKGEGEPVKKREPLYELDTDKVTQEVEAEADGVLLKIVVDSGEVEVGRTIAFIGSEGEEVTWGKAAPAAAEASDEAAVEEQDEARTEGTSAPGMDDQRARGQEAAPRPPRRRPPPSRTHPCAPQPGQGLPARTQAGAWRGSHRDPLRQRPQGRIVADDVERGAGPRHVGPGSGLAAPAGEVEGIELRRPARRLPVA